MTEGPYKLPEGWRWVRLGEVFRLKNGKFIRAGELKSEGKVPVYGSNGLLGFTTIPLLMEGRTIVIGRVGACGAVNVVDAPCWISDNAMFVAEWFIECDIEYIALALRNTDFSSFVRKGAQPSISQEVVYNAPIPLPPLEEQRRIVARIEELMGRVREARRLREEARNDVERLWQAILAQTFPRPGSELPEGWRWVRLGEVCEHRTGIWGPEASDPTRGFPIIRSTEIEGFLIRPQTASVRMVQRGQVDAYKLDTGNILINKSSGSPHLVGWPAIFEDPRDGKTYLFSNFMLRLRVDRRALEPWFLLYYLHSPIARSIYLGAQDTTSGLRNLRVREFMAQPIPLPPLEEQRRIVAHLQEVQEKIKALKEAQEQTEAELKRLEQAILEKAFRGEL